ncbi:hypothetical protein EHI8A_017360 [Entamoeba histolytica HM-1:IMSS-B]|uniref:Calcium load-activated calcium channel n=6 Tax=Entamoeba histolytica TaxID=5759 RepID=C4LY15_ENTH1|nr:hypothetical protein, conserved [Entamoeba histolytica HM-1:IMSS]EMD46868.1 transmembrane and coiledcoil domain containing protein [Entamoeba histolytica KU27]EMH75753.1 hypothetical protein EHI8A_017360 [Entamoeba histolytica HM-1:IMSS-B]EMS17549.1 transmembrane and coiled-coil domain containing protein [Entamoeba histolytica HM-3:IMSS]ENY65147.1 transmembrane and coiled-coil domain containing protein [Entamoeba histolytica HM-1:IMSS-A]GAT93718.1 hypothetical protein conserved [Entamoeba h|eukprot:XP_655931.1 hypothetical protein, conserved [Entamoeba histolytica HM-1:IMSS]
MIFSQIAITVYSLVCCAISEFITKYFVTDSPVYISLNNEAEALEQKISKLGGYENKKKREKLEKDQATIKQQIAFHKFKPMILNLVFMIASTIAVNYMFKPVKVGKLPFQPFSFFTKVTHRNLPGDDMTDCSLFFFYVLMRMAFKPIMAKLFGNDNVNEASFMNAFVPENETFKSK